MIDYYTWTTPNGRKVSIALKELDLPHTVHAIDIGKDMQFDPDFLRISPNNKIPAIVDQDNGLALMESGAILIYLADKAGRLLPASGKGRYKAIQWLMWQMAGPGPIFAQAHVYAKFNKGKAPFAEERFLKETKRLYGVLDKHLAGSEYMIDDYSIADIALWPWVSRFGWHGVDLNDYPNAKRWYVALAGRDAVKQGYNVPGGTDDIPMP